MPDEIVFSVSALPKGGYEARAAVNGIFTQAETIEALMASAKEAVRCHFGDLQSLPTIRFVEASGKGHFRFGSAKGEFTVPDDFNDPLPKEIEDLFYS